MGDDGLVPTRLGRYEVLGRLADGGMAELFVGRLRGPNQFERIVVLKRILPHLSRVDTFVSMFLDEARVVAGIRHPNVVQVHELCHEGDDLFLVMEYLEGETFGALLRRMWLRRESLDVGLAAYMIAEACAGAHAAHELRDDQGQSREVVHRDISPQNLFVTFDGQIKVLDFGIVKARDRITRSTVGEVKGKFEYMSPEQCRGGAVDRRSDVFSLGVTLFELTTSTRLFRRDNELLTFRAVCEDPILRPSTMVAGYPPELERICTRALNRERAARYPTAEALRRDLLEFRRGTRPSEDPASGLAELMRRVMPERIEEKTRFLHAARSRSAPLQVPKAETDLEVELPSVVVDGVISDTAVRAKTAPAAKRTRVVAFATVGAVMAASVGLFLLSRSTGEAPGPPASSSARPEPAPQASNVELEVPDSDKPVVVASSATAPPAAQPSTRPGTPPPAPRRRASPPRSTPPAPATVAPTPPDDGFHRVN